MLAREAIEEEPWAEEDIAVESEDEMCTGTSKRTSHAQQADGYKAPYKTTAADRKARMDRARGHTRFAKDNGGSVDALGRMARPA